MIKKNIFESKAALYIPKTGQSYRLLWQSRAVPYKDTDTDPHSKVSSSWCQQVRPDVSKIVLMVEERLKSKNWLTVISASLHTLSKTDSEHKFTKRMEPCQGLFMRWGHGGHRDRNRVLGVYAVLQTTKYRQPLAILFFTPQPRFWSCDRDDTVHS